MILVDTSVWIDHLRHGNPDLVQLLEGGRAACHPLVIGELACGRLANRAEVLELMASLPRPPEPSHDEVLHVIDRWALMGRGLGIVDVHLLAAARLGGIPLWSLDRRLAAVAAELGRG